MRHEGLQSEAVTGRSSAKKVFLKISKDSQENTCGQSLAFNKVSDLRSATLFKKRLWHRCFPVTFSKILRTYFFIEHLRWLLFYCLSV